MLKKMRVKKKKVLLKKSLHIQGTADITVKALKWESGNLSSGPALVIKVQPIQVTLLL